MKKINIAVFVTGVLALALAFASCGGIFGDVDDLREEAAELNHTRYTITFSINGGVGVTPPQQKISKGSTVTLPGDSGFSHEGFFFNGWNTSSDGSGDNYAAGQTITPASDLALYAIWGERDEDKWLVTYRPNSVSELPPPQEVDKDELIDRPDNPVREGFVFTMWSKTSGADDEWDFTTDRITRDIELYARWASAEGKPVVRFIRNGGKTTNATQFPEDLAVPSGEGFSEPEISRPGYKFGGWYKNSNLTDPWLFGDSWLMTNPANDTIRTGDKVTKNMTLYAKWNPANSVTVNFISYGDNRAHGQTTVQSGNTISAPVAPERDGYVFDGRWWYDDTDLGEITDWKFGTYTVGTRNLNLFAKWISMQEWIGAKISALSGGTTPETAVTLSLDLSLTETNWRGILAGINQAVKYVNLDLSDCMASGDASGGGLRADGTFDPIYNYSMGKNRIVSITLPDAATSIVAGTGTSQSAFNSFTALTKAEGRNITSVGDFAFCNRVTLASADFPKLTTIGVSSFYGCTGLALTSLPDGLVSIGNNAFQNCTILALTSLPDGVVSIGNNAFQNCTGLAELVLPSQLTSIGASAFLGCSGLVLVTCIAETPPSLGSTAFPNATNNPSLWFDVPVVSISAYQAAWSAYADRIRGSAVDITGITAYLNAKTNSGDTNPIFLPLNVQLNQANWQTILTQIAASNTDKYVTLDLSACTDSGIATGSGYLSNGQFNPDYNYTTGKDRIVSITLPSGATGTYAGNSTAVTFRYFTKLRSFGGAGLTSIGNYAFTNCTSLNMTSLPSGIKTIGTNAFQGCANLALTSLPSVLITIGSYAFQGCTNLALTSLPSVLNTISNYAFQNCTNLALTSLPSGLTTIGGTYAFAGCTKLALTSLPSGLTSIASYAFQNCVKISLTELPAGVTTINANVFEGCTSISLFHVYASVNSIAASAFSGCTNLETVYVYDEVPFTPGANVFLNCSPNLKIKVPADSVAAYKANSGWSAYAARIVAMAISMEQITTYLNAQSNSGVGSPIDLSLAEELSLANWQAILAAIASASDKYVDLDLSACTSSDTTSGGLRSDGIFDSYTSTSGAPYTTGKARVVSIILPNAATGMNTGTSATNGAFAGFTNIKSFNGIGLKSIGAYAFYNRTNLAMTKLPAGIETIGSYAFMGCTNLALTSLPAGITIINTSAFSGCTNLALTSLPAGITVIYTTTFMGCTNLALTALPDGLVTINANAFQNCTKLSSLSLPASVNIAGNPFPGCTSLSDFTLTGAGTNLSVVSGGAGEGLVQNNMLVSYPAASGNLVISAGFGNIGGSAFMGCTGLTGITLPAELSVINTSAFSGCTGLESVSLPAGLASITGSGVFMGCTSLKNIALPAGLVSISGSSVFQGCTSLKNITLPAGLTSIGSGVFNGCTSLEEITLPEGIASIPASLFQNCSSLEKLTCLRTTPPTLVTSTLNGTPAELKILVPSASVGDYKAAAVWVAYAAQIFAIE